LRYVHQPTKFVTGSFVLNSFVYGYYSAMPSVSQRMPLDAPISTRLLGIHSGAAVQSCSWNTGDVLASRDLGELDDNRIAEP
jgi:hypothetical protein